jgi:hypothetical protein
MELWVEGPTDALTAWREPGDEDRPHAEGGALVPLVRKKAKLEAVLESYPDLDDRVAAFRKLAEEIDLATLERSCPRGFGAFRAALVELICPLLQAPQG